MKLEENGAEAGSVLAQLHCEDCGGGGAVSARQRIGPETVSNMAKTSSTWTVTTTGPRGTATQAGWAPGPKSIGSGKLTGGGVVTGRVEVAAATAEGTMTVFVATGCGAVATVGPTPMHEQALSNRYCTSP